jgi:hypothetical protein
VIVLVPHWLLVPLTAILPAFGIRRTLAPRRRWRLARSLCAGCGYDLRATPGRCPECGKISTTRNPPIPAACEI